MTKKDYELISETIRQMFSLGENRLYVADMFYVKLAHDNPKLDRQRFLKACGITE